MRRALVLACFTVATASASPFAGSSVVYRNQMSVISVDRSAEQTYDPLYVMSVGLRPRADLGAGIYARGGLTIARELTESNWTTEARETYLSDTTLAVGGTLWTVPTAEIDLSAELGARLPTSEASQARTLRIAIEPSLRVSRRFGVLSGLTVGYGFAFAVDLHRFTTAERVEPTIDAEPSTLGTGVRNTRWRMSHRGDLSLAIVPTLSVALGAGLHQHELHDAQRLTMNDAIVDDRARREYLSASASVTIAPWEALGLTVGASTFHDQLATDGTRRQPLFNRFTNLFVALRFTPEALITTDSETDG